MDPNNLTPLQQPTSHEEYASITSNSSSNRNSNNGDDDDDNNNNNITLPPSFSSSDRSCGSNTSDDNTNSNTGRPIVQSTIKLPPPSTPGTSQRQRRRSRNRGHGGRNKKNNPTTAVVARSVRNVTNLSKETQLLRNRLDKVVECFQETVVVQAQTQTKKFELLQTENKQLQLKIRQLEIENLRYFSDMADSDELMVSMEERRLLSRKEVLVWKGHCSSLSKEVKQLKKIMDTQQQQQKIIQNDDDDDDDDDDDTTADVHIQKEELVVENTSLKNELNKKDITICKLEEKLTQLKIQILENKENLSDNGGVVVCSGGGCGVMMAGEKVEVHTFSENNETGPMRIVSVLRERINKDDVIITNTTDTSEYPKK